MGSVSATIPINRINLLKLEFEDVSVKEYNYFKYQ